MSSILLPAAFTICASLGIARTDCTKFAINGNFQTDTNLWYSGVTSRPDDLGPPDEHDCRSPVPIAKYDIYDGSHGTSYACLRILKDDQITDQEISRIGDLARRLNSISPKTLQDHDRAMALKDLVKILSGEYP